MTVFHLVCDRICPELKALCVAQPDPASHLKDILQLLLEDGFICAGVVEWVVGNNHNEIIARFKGANGDHIAVIYRHIQGSCVVL